MKATFTYWKESDGWYLGYLNDYPDHWTQGEDLKDLKEQLRDLLAVWLRWYAGVHQVSMAQFSVEWLRPILNHPHAD